MSVSVFAEPSLLLCSSCTRSLRQDNKFLVAMAETSFVQVNQFTIKII